MNAQRISTATIKKWEAIACDRDNHAFVAYERNDGLLAIGVFEVLNVFTNENGAPCLHALLVSAKYNWHADLDPAARWDSEQESVNRVEIPLSAIVESHRCQRKPDLHDTDIRRYHASLSKARRRTMFGKHSGLRGNRIRLPDVEEPIHDQAAELFNPWMGCAMWLLYAIALLAITRWIF